MSIDPAVTPASAPPLGPAPEATAAYPMHDTAGLAQVATVWRWVMRQQRRSLLTWALAVGAVSGLYAVFYDLMDMSQLEDLVLGLPEAMVAAMGYDRIGSLAGYLEATVYGLLGPALLMVFAITTSARNLAGTEEDGSLELEATSAVSRRQLLLGRLAVVVSQVTVLSLVVAAVVAAVVASTDAVVPIEGLAAVNVGLWLFVVSVATVTFAAGAASGRRGLAVGVGAGFGVLSYVADALAAMVDTAAWLANISPFSWYLAGDPLHEGFAPGDLAAIAAVCIAAIAVALVTFERRDLGT